MANTEEKVESVEDMVNMVVLDEASILANLRDRFKNDQIYTNVGAILISVNPYRAIPSLYAKNTLKSYQAKDSQGSPHIFKVTEAAYRRMLDYETDQSILISGESGAGKTEACKCILQYLAEVSGQGGKIQDQILDCNPLMEAFGNAKTVRNNNSSRFGKFIQLKFSRTGQLVGADITKYLLEKSRVVYQAPQERNYHIFYEMCAGLSGPLRNALHIGPAEEYKYLNQGKTMTIEGVNDSAQFEITKRAMKTIGIPDDKQKEIFQVLAAILHIGNINFEFIKETDSVVVKNEKEVDIAAKLLGIKSSTLNFALCHRDIIVSGQTFKKPLDLKQAVDSRDALAKGLYERLFDWLVDRINKSIASLDGWHTIGVLDIFGFEFFDTNSLEQLSINYCNEKLQLMYNTHVFQQEHKEYTSEGISCENVEFVDNQPCIDFFEKNLGIMSILDEECKFPQATDRTFLEKLEANHKNNPVFGKELRANSRFLVRHFAGEVMYDVAGFMDKNRDTLRPELAILVKKSEVSFVKLLFGDRPVSENSGSPTMGRANSSNGAPSVCSQFKHQLNRLMTTLSSTQPHFIRCVKPNVLKLPDIFDEKLVCAQLRYTGVLGTIKIRQAGYPVRFPFSEFVHRYSLLGFKNKKQNNFANIREEASALAVALNLGIYQIGKTKIFFKSPRAFDELEAKRKIELGRSAARIQSLFRGRKQKVKYEKIKKIAVAFQTAARLLHARHQLLHLKEERTRRIREEQIQRDKEQKQKEEQMRKEREQKQKEKEEKEREMKEQRAKQAEEAQKMNAKRYKYKYKHCTCNTPREDEKENFNPNKNNSIQVIADLLTLYGASSIGNVYEDGRTIQVELFLYKYEFMNKMDSKAPTTGMVPKKVGPSSSAPPKPPMAPLKTSLAKPGPLKSLAKPSASASAQGGKEGLREIKEERGGGRGATGPSSGILSKMNQFQSKLPEPDPSPRITSPRVTSPRSSNAAYAAQDTPASLRNSAAYNAHENDAPRKSASTENVAQPAHLSPRKSASMEIAHAHRSSHAPSPRTHSVSPSPRTSLSPSPYHSPSHSPAISASSTPSTSPRTSIVSPRTSTSLSSSPSPSPSLPPSPPPLPAKPAVVLPPPPVRVVVQSPGVVGRRRGNTIVSPSSDGDAPFPSFKELRALMAKKLPTLLSNLSTALQENMNAEDEEVTLSNQMDTWNQYKNMVAPPPPTELQLLGSLTKERAKPPSARRARTKPAKGEKPPPGPTPSPNQPPPTSSSTSSSSSSSRPLSLNVSMARPSTAPAVASSLSPSLSPSSATEPSLPLSTPSPSPSPAPSHSAHPAASRLSAILQSAPLRPSTPPTSANPSSSTSSSPSPDSSTQSPSQLPQSSLSPSSSPAPSKARPPVPNSRVQRPFSQEVPKSPEQAHNPRASSPSPPSASPSPSSPTPTPSVISRPPPRPHSQPTPVIMSGTRQMPSPSPSPSSSTASKYSVISSKSSRRYGGVLIEGEEIDENFEKTDEITKEPGLAPKNVMGVDPGTLSYATDLGFKVPNFLGSLRTVLTKNNGLEKEGIFRMAGREDTINKLSQDISEGITQLVCDDPLSVAAFVKRWYSRMPQKLFAQLSTEDIESIYSLPHKVKAVTKAKLTESYYNMFWWLIALMHEVAAKSETNKMTPKNLATMLGPVVFEIGADMADLQKNQKIVTILQHILEYHVEG